MYIKTCFNGGLIVIAVHWEAHIFKNMLEFLISINY